MLTWIKLGNKVYRNIEAKYIDENGNEIWNVPNTVPELQKALADTLVWLSKRRLNEILDQYGYNGLGDIIFYANQATPDPEAQAILAWYQEYDNGIWNWIGVDLQAFTIIDEFLQLDMKQVEENIFNQAVATAPLP